LLAACERVLELKKGIVDQVRYAARSLTPEKAQQLELLLTQDRSVQVLMDKTLGVSNVVSATNIESLVDSMKQTLADNIRRDADAKIAATNRDAAGKVRKAHEARRAAEQQVATLGNAVNRFDAEDRSIVSQLFEDTNSAIRRHRFATILAVSTIVFAIGALPLLIESVSGRTKFIALLASGLVAGLLALLQLFDIPVGLEGWTSRYARRKLNKIAQKRGIIPKLCRFQYEYKGRKFCFFEIGHTETDGRTWQV
jgi:hypothetical protein